MICTVWNADLNFFLLFPVQGQKERSKLWLCSKAAAVLLLLEVHSTGWRGNMLVGCLVWGNSDHRPCDISRQQSGMSCVLECLGCLSQICRSWGITLGIWLKGQSHLWEQSQLLWGRSSCGTSTPICTHSTHRSVSWASPSSHRQELIL